MARRRWRAPSKQAGADLLACADIEEGTALRAAGVRAEILVFGALSVSDLDGLFDGRLTPTISTPGAANAVQAAAARYRQRVRYHLKIDTGMNRLGFRFDNLRRTLPGCWRARTSSSMPSTPTLRRPTCRTRHCSRCSASGSSARWQSSTRSAVGRAIDTPPTAPRCCATHASGSTESGRGCCSMGWRRRHWRRRWRSRR